MQVGLSRLFFPVLLAGVLAGTMGCSDGDEIHRCNDGLDNDLDGLVDNADPGCVFNGDDEAPDPVACNDGEDNDGDGLIDRDDPGCTTDNDTDEFEVPSPACNDGLDNDGDGIIDFPFDPGCFLPLEDSEEDGCGSGGVCPACSNGLDDDGDGLVDYPIDPGCSHAGSPDEFNLDGGACGGDLIVSEFPDTGEAVGLVRAGGQSALDSPICGGAGVESVWVVRVREPATLVVSTNHPTTTADTVVYFRRDCLDPTTELACNDNVFPTAFSSEFIIEVTEPGVYYLIVDAATSASVGGFRVSIDYYTLTGQPCNPGLPSCAPGQTCRPVMDGGTDRLCLPSQCQDGFDNDGDGMSDYPNDPGCSVLSDITEADGCPDGANCPGCGNGVDDDGDGLTDFPGDSLGCTAASDDTEDDECTPGIDVLPYPPGGVTGTTPGYASGQSNFEGSCDTSTTPTEHIYAVPVSRALETLQVSTEGSPEDTVLYVRYSDCGNESAEIGCAQIDEAGESLTFENPDPGLYYVFVDGDTTYSIDYVLNITGIIPLGGDCEPGDLTFVCGTGKLCDPGSNTCVISQCADGVDNDGDGVIDYPLEPGCGAADDNDETDDCPLGLGCPECGNGVDDDYDGLIDYSGTDPGCESTGDVSEVDACVPDVYPLLLPLSGVSGTTPPSAEGSEFSPSCNSSTSSTEDVYYFPLTQDLTSLTFTTEGSMGDTVLSVRNPGCGNLGDELACNNAVGGGEDVTLDSPAQGVYFVFVDGNYASNIDYELNIRGTIAPGAACDPDNPNIVCEEGQVCNPSSMVCEDSQCNNGTDDDGDGISDFPADPGCQTISDNDETDDCPSGPLCPACSNEVDDDGDGVIDYPDDIISCVSASDTREVDECIIGVPLQTYTPGGVSSTTPLPGSGQNHFNGSCDTSPLPSEHVYAVPIFQDLTSVSFSTEGSSGDTVLYARLGECANSAAEVDCAQVSSGGESFTLANPEQGIYYVFVDGNSASELEYVLNVEGTIGLGSACDPADITFVCDPGTTCDPGTNTCIVAQCNNGTDDDGDGLVDYLLDPGCDTPSDDDETDDCPDGPGCPECGNGVDDDFDTIIDHTNADPGCLAASDPEEIDACIPGLFPNRLTLAGASGTTPPSGNADFSPSCHPSTASTEDVYYFKLDQPYTSLTFSTEGSEGDTVLSVRNPGCGVLADELACAHEPGGGEAVTLQAPLPGVYYVFVDGDYVSEINYVLNVFATVAPGATCDPASTSITCEPGYICDPGTTTCVPTQCNNGVDDDGDGLSDYPNDPGCATTSDEDETDDCQSGGPDCPLCSNGVDDDGDGLIDYPADVVGCLSASDDGEEDECEAGIPALAYPPGGVVGRTPASSTDLNNYNGSCDTSTYPTEDIYSLQINYDLLSVTFSTEGSQDDTVLYVRYGACGDGVEIACADPTSGGETITIPTPAQGLYYVFVDGDYSTLVDYTLNIGGIIGEGSGCDPADTVFHCDEGYACDPGSNTCVIANCNNGADDDGDGLSDYPNDPGCASINDHVELDTCPGGADCPECSNGQDDDFDGLLDNGNDPGCDAAGDDEEVDECIAGVYPERLPAGGLSGTTPPTGSGSNFTPGCNSSATSTEDVYYFTLIQDLSSITFSTVGSAGDTVLSVRSPVCGDEGAELACMQEPNAGESITLATPTQGMYYVFVDGDFTSGINYVLDVWGTIAPGKSCDPADSDFVCETGYACDPMTESCVISICDNGIDDDGDGAIDFPLDPGCATVSDNDELDDCPGGPGCAACANGVDDDGDGLSDYPADVIGCIAAGDSNEADECEPGVATQVYPVGGASGTTPAYDSGEDRYNGSCDASTTPTEVIYTLSLTQDLESLTFSTEGSAEDTVLYVRYGNCADSAAEVGCDDPGTGGESFTLATPAQGIYYVFVDGDYTSSVDYVLDISGEIAPGIACDPADTMFQCTPGHFCDPVLNRCVVAMCGNGTDDDGDGLIDYPDDPGCASTRDSDEIDTCPGGLDCPACSNGVDDDLDGLLDYSGMDPGCEAAGDTDEMDACIADLFPAPLPITGVSGTTPASGSNFSPSCHGSTLSAEDVYYFLLSDNLSSLTFSTEGSEGDTVLSVRNPVCGSLSDELACMNVQNGGESVTLNNPTQGAYYVFVDGDYISGINYVLNVWGTIAPGMSCDPADAYFTCEEGFACDPVGQTCVAALCSNGTDDDGDGLTDYPQDPGCEEISDHDEVDDCPGGPLCAACSNGVDDDGDGYMDYGDDLGCLAAGDVDESNECVPGVLFTYLPDSGIAATTPPSDAGSNFKPSCNGSTTSTEHVSAYRVTRDLESLSFSTQGSTGDTVLSVRYDSCGDAASEIACKQAPSSGEAVTILNPGQGTYYVFVDGDYTSEIDYVLNVKGTVGMGGACDPADALFPCRNGLFCDAATFTCEVAACANGVDDDGDALLDYPVDPGCASWEDDDELDDCPTGPLCAACSNFADDDIDLYADYPADIGCMSAGDDDEGVCPEDSDPKTLITGTSTTGSTLVGINDFAPACVTNSTASDQVYLLQFPGYMDTLTVNTDGSSYDTVMYIREGECSGEELACDDDAGVGNKSQITLNWVAPGQYIIIVDGYGVNAGSVTVNVSGTIAAGERCDENQVASGMFSCATGFACLDLGTGYFCQ